MRLDASEDFAGLTPHPFELRPIFDTPVGIDNYQDSPVGKHNT